MSKIVADLSVVTSVGLDLDSDSGDTAIPVTIPVTLH